MENKIGLLVMAYGTPGSLDEVESYYTHIRGGRKPSPAMLSELIHRYEKIGGISPLARITREQIDKLETKLNQVNSSFSFKVYLGQKHVFPFIEDAVRQMKEDGIQKAITLVLAPHYSSYSSESYHERAREESKKINGPSIMSIRSWYKEPSFITYWSQELKNIYTGIPKEEQEKNMVIFTAHSLPQRILELADPYPEEIMDNAKLIAEQASIPYYDIAWQSAGRSPEPWLGPDILEKIRLLYKEGYTSIIICPIGFVADHLEVLYDNDYECCNVAKELGIHYFRPAMPNAQDEFIDGLASAVLKKLLEKGEPNE
mgnify:CR=1 FL=1